MNDIDRALPRNAEDRVRAIEDAPKIANGIQAIPCRSNYGAIWQKHSDNWMNDGRT